MERYTTSMYGLYYVKTVYIIYKYSIGITYVTHALDPPFSRILTQPHAILKVPHTYSHEVPGRKNTKTGESVRKCEVLF
jgi:hypothetical protein